jgi:two-component system cell cycle response regulator
MARILVVEDEPETRYALTQVLSGRGHRLVEADGAAATVERLGEQAFDLLICDLHMAHGQGVAVLAEVRRQRPDLEVLAIAGGGLAGGIDRIAQAKALGATVILHKPFDSETLIAAAERLLAAPARGEAAR